MVAAILFQVSALLLPLTSVSDASCVPVFTPTAVEAHALSEFHDRVERYQAVHRAVEESVWHADEFDDLEEIFDAMEAMRSGIRAARSDARRGDIFTDPIAGLIRRRLMDTLVACRYRIEDVLAFINEERLPGAAKPQINEPFPWELGSAMWPTLLAGLPPLPEDLQYRFADRDLVLVDIHADIVVDILRRALPAPAREIVVSIAMASDWTAGRESYDDSGTQQTIHGGTE